MVDFDQDISNSFQNWSAVAGYKNWPTDLIQSETEKYFEGIIIDL